MPLFEYLCKECHHRFEALVVGTRRPEACPRCNSPEIEKQFSTFGMGGGYSSGPAWGSSSSCGTSGGG
jgi:putative FmdB family regulatory protein